MDKESCNFPDILARLSSRKLEMMSWNTLILLLKYTSCIYFPNSFLELGSARQPTVLNSIDFYHSEIQSI